MHSFTVIIIITKSASANHRLVRWCPDMQILPRDVKAGGVDTVGPLLALASSIEEGEGDTKILGNELKGKSHDNLIFVR